eukprot:1629059-Rhodomonas_salina.3
MIKLGTDALSREHLQDPHNAAIDDVAWERVLALARRAELTLRVDWFSDRHNHCLPVFGGRYASPEPAGTDALSAPSWDHSYCPQCPAVSSHAGFFFPPIPLFDHVAAKAKQDGAAGIIVLPCTVSSVWWPVFVAAAICPPVPLHASAVTLCQGGDPQYNHLDWNLIAFDFGCLPWRLDQLHSCPLLAPPDPRSLATRLRRHEELHARLSRALLEEEVSPSLPDSS